MKYTKDNIEQLKVRYKDYKDDSEYGYYTFKATIDDFEGCELHFLSESQGEYIVQRHTYKYINNCIVEGYWRVIKDHESIIQNYEIY
jgi:hypothetical protein